MTYNPYKTPLSRAITSAVWMTLVLVVIIGYIAGQCGAK